MNSMAYKNLENIRKLEMDSDEVMDINCDLCKEHGVNNIQVEGFCFDCEQYFCSTCLRYHQKFLQTHKIQDNNDMPKDLCKDMCNEHKELIKFYCETCNAFVCLKCKTDNHKDCTKVKFLPLLVQNIENNEEFQDFERKVTKFETALNATKESIDKNLLIKLTTVENYKRQAINALKCQRQEMLEDFETAIKRFERTIEENYTSDKAKHVCVSETVNSVANEFIMLKNDISNHKRSQQRCKLFMKMKKALPKINVLARKLANARDDSAFTVTVYKYKPQVSILKGICVGVMEINGEVISDDCKKVSVQQKWREIEEKTMAVKIMLKENEKRCQYLEQKSKEVEQKSTDNDQKSREIEQSFKNLQEKLRYTEQKSTDTEQRLQESRIKLRDAEQKSSVADQKLREAEQKFREAELKSRETEQTAQKSEQVTREAEQKLKEIKQNLNNFERQVSLKISSESDKTIHNSILIESKLIEAEQNSLFAERKSREAEKRLTNAKQKSKDAEQKSRDAEQKSRKAEQKSRKAEPKSKEAEQKSEEAEKKSREAEERFRKAQQKSNEAVNKSREADQKFEKATQMLKEAERARLFFRFTIMTGIISSVWFFFYIFLP